jgi:hypothetical protein
LIFMLPSLLFCFFQGDAPAGGQTW